MTRQGTLIDGVKTTGRKAVARFSSLRHGNPGKKLKLIGVTGTKGKTITTLMIYHILKNAGLNAACISSISAKIGDQEFDTGFHVTSPEPWDLPRYLSRMVKEGVEYVVLETTSNGLQQGRFAGLDFEVAVITNIDTDHLDYHQTWENYADAKFMLVEKLKQDGLVVVNADHASSEWLRQRSEVFEREVYATWFSKQEAHDFEQSFAGMKFNYQGVQFQLAGFGQHYLENTLAAIKATSRYLGVEQIAQSLRSYQTPQGRMQVVQTEPYTIIVDFAHTPDSLERSLHAVYELKGIDSRIITVFGCAGDRDVSRRAMGVPAAKYSKAVFLTAEDPREESLAAINTEIFDYMQQLRGVMIERVATHAEFEQMHVDNLLARIDRVIQNDDIPVVAFDEMSVNSRVDAIDLALQMAQPGDVVFITGKGHEQSLCFGETEFEWSDQEVIKNLLAKQS